MRQGSGEDSVFGVERQNTQPSVETLIARLEAATAGSRELDGEIIVTLDLRPDWLSGAEGELFVDASDPSLVVVRFHDDCIPRKRRGAGCPPIGSYPAYTTSIDAALTLVPNGHVVYQLTIWPGQPAQVSVWGTHDARRTRGMLSEAMWQWAHNPVDGRWEGKATTAPIALCIAALHARKAVPQTVSRTPGSLQNTDETNNNSSNGGGDA